MHLRVGEDGDPPQRRDALNNGRQRADPADDHVALLCVASEVAAQRQGGARGAGEGEAPDGTPCRCSSTRIDISDIIPAAHRGLSVRRARAGGAETCEDVVCGDEVDDSALMRGAARAAPHFRRQPLRHRLGGRLCRRAEEPMVIAHQQGRRLAPRLRSDPVHGHGCRGGIDGRGNVRGEGSVTRRARRPALRSRRLLISTGETVGTPIPRATRRAARVPRRTTVRWTSSSARGDGPAAAAGTGGRDWGDLGNAVQDVVILP
eukprot:gene5706-biopygen661